MLTFGSYFTGGGLADIGAMQAGFQLLFGVEFDPLHKGGSARFADTYETNLGKHIIRQDVCEIDITKIPTVTWFHASPVCVNFSTAKSTGVEDDIDYQTAKAVTRYIAHHQPAIITIENVIGYKDSDSFRLILQALEGYKIRIAKVGMHLYQIPQKRYRLFILASKIGISFPPTSTTLRGWYEAIHDLPLQKAFMPAKLQLVHTRLDLSTPIYGYFLNHMGVLNQPNYKRIYLPHEPAPTVIALAYRKWYMIRNRLSYIFTPRMFARIQTVPDWYKLPESPSLATRLLGNGIPSKFMHTLGLHIKDELNQC